MGDSKSTFKSVGEIAQKIIDRLIIEPTEDEQKALDDLTEERQRDEFFALRETTGENKYPVK